MYVKLNFTSSLKFFELPSRNYLEASAPKFLFESDMLQEYVPSNPYFICTSHE